MNYDPLKAEEDTIKLFNGANTKKKVVALAKQIYFKTEDPTQKTLCVSIATAKNPLKQLEFCRLRIAECYQVMEQFIAEGNHGMIMHNEQAYPVRIDTRSNWLTEDKKWTVEDEDEIMDKLVRSWMVEHDKKTFAGKIALFTKFGFSGSAILIVI